jgi:predicted nucleic acid-binding protein
MPDAVSNTSPLLYLFRIGAIEWLRQLFTEVLVPGAWRVRSRRGDGRATRYRILRAIRGYEELSQLLRARNGLQGISGPVSWP